MVMLPTITTIMKHTQNVSYDSDRVEDESGSDDSDDNIMMMTMMMMTVMMR